MAIFRTMFQNIEILGIVDGDGIRVSGAAVAIGGGWGRASVITRLQFMFSWRSECVMFMVITMNNDIHTLTVLAAMSGLALAWRAVLLVEVCMRNDPN